MTAFWNYFDNRDFFFRRISWKCPNMEFLSDPYFPVFGSEKTPSLNTFLTMATPSLMLDRTLNRYLNWFSSWSRVWIDPYFCNFGGLFTYFNEIRQIHIFYEQLGSGTGSQSCLYFQDFQGSNLLYICLVAWPNTQILSIFQWLFNIWHWDTVHR